MKSKSIWLSRCIVVVIKSLVTSYTHTDTRQYQYRTPWHYHLDSILILFVQMTVKKLILTYGTCHFVKCWNDVFFLVCAGTVRNSVQLVYDFFKMNWAVALFPVSSRFLALKQGHENYDVERATIFLWSSYVWRTYPYSLHSRLKMRLVGLTFVLLGLKRHCLTQCSDVFHGVKAIWYASKDLFCI
jgi:hypothetical protein